MILSLLQGLAFGFSNAVSPGPFQAYLLSQTLQRGWRRSWIAAFAPLITDGPIITIMVLLLLQAPGWFLRGLQIAGGLFIWYLAWGAWQVVRQNPVTPTSTAAPPAASGLRNAVVMNALSPGLYIFWSTIGGPLLLESWQISPWVSLSFLTGFYVTMISVLLGLIALFAVARRLDPRIIRALNAFSALLLFIFGAYQLWKGLFG